MYNRQGTTPLRRHTKAAQTKNIIAADTTTTTTQTTRTTRTPAITMHEGKALKSLPEALKTRTTSKRAAIITTTTNTHINAKATKKMTIQTTTNTTTAIAHRKRMGAWRVPASSGLKCTRRLCLLAFYSALLLAAHAAFASEVKSHTHTQQTTAIPSIPPSPVTTTDATITNATTTDATTTIISETTTTSAESIEKYSQPLVAAGSFQPLIPIDLTPEDISRQIFTPKGQYRVFESAESDLRATSAMRQHGSGGGDAANAQASSSSSSISSGRQPPSHVNEIPSSGDKELEALLTEYVQNFFTRGQIEPQSELVHALQKNATVHRGSATPVERAQGDADDADDEALDDDAGAEDDEAVLIRHVRDAVKLGRSSGSGNGGGGADGPDVSINIPRALQSGRLLFFTGLKKVLWPVLMGLQILKSLLFALLLPTLIGSVGKLLGKGIISGSAPLFIRPIDAPQEVDFKDNSLNFDDDNKFALNDFEGTKDDSYAYNHPEASQTHNQYAYNAASVNQRYGNEQQQQQLQYPMQDSYLSALQSLSSASFKNSNSISGSSSAGGLGGGGGGGLGGALSGALGGGGAALTAAAPTRNNKPAAPPAANVNTFQTFQKVPASSLLLSNYDPFYSPLLSRLDSVFAQLKLNSESEVCREKLICLMYANPAKYAPYSNLVSAQLSRELNELRKPTSDNPDILRFFKYMRAAKDGQDGVDCEKTFAGCAEFKDFENPAMVSTYHDINKLVQARKLTT